MMLSTFPGAREGIPMKSKGLLPAILLCCLMIVIVTEVTGEFCAGQMYFSVPITYVTLLNNGVTQTFVGCYVMHLSQPGIQGEPPFRPLGIIDATVKEVASNADTVSLMAQACNGQRGG